MWAAALDTIAQIATAPGNGVGMVRMSGPDAHRLGRQLVGLSSAPTPRTLVYAHARDATATVIDTGLYVEFVAPKSFTGEPVAEFQAHGSAVGLSRILRRLVDLGARPAEAGEFSFRAFRNGKMDLAQLEAVSAAIASEGEASFLLAQRQAQGELSAAVEAIRGPLLDAATSLVAEVEFPDEDLTSMDRERVERRLVEATSAIERLLEGHASAARLHHGAVIALVGPPNAGKSSLLNGLAGFDRAIVSPVAGTTRDTVEVSCVIAGVVCRVVDTAGIRDAANDIEAQGIERSERVARTADVVLWLQSSDVSMLRVDWLTTDERVVRVASKADVLAGSPANSAGLRDWFGPTGLQISTVTGEGMDALRDLLGKRLLPSGSPGLVSQERHAVLLRQAAEALSRGARAMQAGLACELVLVDVNMAIQRLGEVVGENVSEEVLAQIFQRFCIGK